MPFPVLRTVGEQRGGLFECFVSCWQSLRSMFFLFRGGLFGVVIMHRPTWIFVGHCHGTSSTTQCSQKKRRRKPTTFRGKKVSMNLSKHRLMQNPSTDEDGNALPRSHTNNTSVGVLLVVNVAKEFVHIVPVVLECGCARIVMSCTLLIVEKLMIKV